MDMVSNPHFAACPTWNGDECNCRLTTKRILEDPAEAFQEFFVCPGCPDGWCKGCVPEDPRSL